MAILCEAICDHGAALLIRHLGDRLGEYEIWRMMPWINALSQRSFDIALGLLAGIAVASVVKRRRRVIPLLTAALLAAALPILFKVDVQIRMTFYEPIFEAIYGPPEPPSRVPLAVGPTFSVGITAPSLAGTWHLEYTTGEADHTQEITIDASGAITAVEHPRNNSDESIHFVVDGQSHEINTAAMPAGRTAGYRALASCERYDEHVRINLRFECTIERTHGGVTDYMPVDSEERLTGTLSDDNTTIAGTSHYRMEAPGINFDPDHLDRAFVMRRISTASQPTTTATSREAESHNQP